MFAKILPACLAVLLTSSGAYAGTNLVLNGNFESTTPGTGKYQVTTSNVTNWSVVTSGSLTYLDTPGTADNGTYLSVYKGFPATDTQQANGGNFIEADGDPKYAKGGVYQLVTGLAIGQAYMLTFDFAGGEQSGFTSASGYTTEWWNVSLDTSFQNPSNTQQTAVLTTPNGGYSPWQTASMTFTATAASEYLTFLAGGTPSGAPPIAFLDNVTLQAPTAVPEPMTLSLLGVGLVGAVAATRRRRSVAPA